MASETHSVPTLYHVPYFSSSIPYQLLLELGTPSSQIAVKTITDVELRTHKSIPAFSPRRVVPFMVFPDGSAMVEAGAIVIHLCETLDHSHKLHPALGDAHRSRFLQGVVFGVAEGYKAVIACFLLCYKIAKEERDTKKLSAAKENFEKVVVGHLVKELKGGERKYYLGEEFSAVDVVFGYILMTAGYCDAGLIENEIVKNYHESLEKRPTYTKLFCCS